MTFQNVPSPAEYYADPTIGRPIFNGSIYIGEPDTDPEIAANQIQVYALQEAGGVPVAIGQPIATSAGGVPVDSSGNNITLQISDTQSTYSIKVLDKQGNQEYYFQAAKGDRDGNPVYATFDSVASMVAGTPIDGDTVDYALYASNRAMVQTQAFYAGWVATVDSPKGGSLYTILTAAEYGTTPDGFADHYVGEGVLYVAALINTSSTSAYSLGAIRDSSTNNNAVFQAYSDYCTKSGVDFILESGVNTSLEYLLTTVITFASPISVRGRGAIPPRILCNNSSLFDYAVGAEEVTIENIRAATAVRHTTTPNTLFAVRFKGDTSNRPFYIRIRNNFFDGFGAPLLTEWAWEMRIHDNNIVNCGQVIKATGISVNNHLNRNSFSGNGLAILIGDGTETIEGWQITENLFDSFAGCLDAVGASYCWFKDNICDFIESGTGVLFRSAGTKPSIGNKIKGNYIAFEGAGSEGIRLLNNIVSPFNNGSTVEDNEIFSYSNGSVIRGILTDGTGEEHNRIIANSIVATTEDCDNSNAANSIVKNNVFNGAGFNTSVIVEYSGNQGAFNASEELTKRALAGTRTEYWRVSVPTSGTFVLGDIVYNLAPGLDVNNMSLLGWRRISTGSNNVIGTDWVNMYVSHTSPAT